MPFQFNLQAGDVVDVLAAERMEFHGLVEPVDAFPPEVTVHVVHHFFLDDMGVLTFLGQLLDEAGALV